MNPVTNPKSYRLSALVAAIALATGLAACSKSEEEAARAQVDTAVARSAEAARDAEAKAAAAAENARQATVEAGRDVKDAAQEAAADASAAANRAGAEIREGAAELKADVSAAAAAASDLVDDVAITASVNAGLAKDPDLSAIRIDVDTKDGVVTLNGPAPSSTAKARAETIAKDVKGVKSVTNKLEVRS